MPPGRHSSSRRSPKGITIIYEDSDLIVVEKPPGLLTISTAGVKTGTLYYELTDYVRKGNARSRERVFIVHRLDRDASGILVFARNERAKSHLQSQWEDVSKTYLAVVRGSVRPMSGTITSYLAENKAHVVYSTPNRTEGKLSRTAYRVLREGDGRSLLSIDLLTGRKHQIRVHLAEKGHPIVGDKRYGNLDRVHRRLALHAKSLAFNHPATGERMAFATKTPKYLTDLVGPATA